MIIEVRGGGHPLLGRLRGVKARHEIRRLLDVGDEDHTIDFEAPDAHLVFRSAVPSPLPDMLSNAERQLVIHQRVADMLVKQGATLRIVPVRLVDAAGAVVSKDHVVAAPKKVVNCVESEGGSIGGYIMGMIKSPKEPTQELPPVYRIGYSLAIGCNRQVAAELGRCSGSELVAFPSYAEVLLPFPRAAYEILHCGTEGATLGFAGGEHVKALEEGTSLAKTWTTAVTQMRPPKSRKRMVDFTRAPGAPVITAKARAVLEQFGVDGVELLPTQVKDHAGHVVKGDFRLLHVVATRPYVDVAESDIEVVHDLLWTAREIIVAESRLDDRPPMFRVPGARYPWVFVRRDVIDAMEAAKLTGFRTEHPLTYEHTVEGGGIPHVC